MLVIRAIEFEVQLPPTIFLRDVTGAEIPACAQAISEILERGVDRRYHALRVSDNRPGE